MCHLTVASDYKTTIFWTLIGPHANAIYSVESCPLSLITRWIPLLTDLSWLHLSSLSLADLVISLKPGTSQCSACCAMRWWSIRNTWQNQHSLLSLRMLAMLYCLVLALTFSFVILSFKEILNMPLCVLIVNSWISWWQWHLVTAFRAP